MTEPDEFELQLEARLRLLQLFVENLAITQIIASSDPNEAFRAFMVRMQTGMSRTSFSAGSSADKVHKKGEALLDDWLERIADVVEKWAEDHPQEPAG